MSSNVPDRTPNPRMVLAILAVVMAAQGVYAALAIFSESSVAAGPLQLVLGVAFVIYAAMIVAFAFGIWRRMSWAWPLAVAIAAAGLLLALLQIAAGDPFGDHLFGMAIDAVLLYYLFKPSIRSLFTA